LFRWQLKKIHIATLEIHPVMHGIESVLDSNTPSRKISRYLATYFVTSLFAQGNYSYKVTKTKVYRFPYNVRTLKHVVYIK